MKQKKVNKNLKSLNKREDRAIFNKYKNDEFVGDALISFIVRDYFASQSIERNLSRTTVYIIVSNKHLSKVFDDLQLELNPVFHINAALYKAKANQIEYMVYDIYNKEGFNKAKEFVINNIIRCYYENEINKNKND